MFHSEIRVIPLGVAGCPGQPSETGTGLPEGTLLTTAVRYGYMKYVGEFSYKPGIRFTCGAKVVVQTERGIEIGNHLSRTCSGCSHSIPRQNLAGYAERSGEDFFKPNCGKILREATLEDLNEERHMREKTREKLARCDEHVQQRNLPMKMVECEHLFGGERIIFYFFSDNRVDFRELVKDLAGEYHTRIEMRQIGARDEARLLADYETCGQECCCRTFLKSLRQINMKMAKLQKQTLDPTKVSGRCGRLKCCLRYEQQSYEELESRLPRMGRQIRTAMEEGIVVDRQILTQLVVLETQDQRRLVVPIEDVLEQLGPAGPSSSESESDPESGNRGNSESQEP